MSAKVLENVVLCCLREDIGNHCKCCTREQSTDPVDIMH
jgi:hypothetical protein